MEFLNRKEHLRCYSYDSSEKPQIQVVKYIKGESVELTANTNEIILFLDGAVKCLLWDNIEYEVIKGKILFLPAEHSCSCSIESDAHIMIFRLNSPMKLCENYFAEYLFDSVAIEFYADDSPKRIKMLNINSRVRHFVRGVGDCIADGIRCKHYFDMKIKEFFLMLRAYYSKDELCEFLSMILSRDIVFSEYVKSQS